MATVIPTRLDLILPLIKQRLMEVFTWPPECVLISCRREKDGEAHPMGANQYLRIRALGATPDQGLWEGGERVDPVHSRICKVTLYTQLNADTMNMDEAFATDPDLGHYKSEHQIFEALMGWFPSDASGNIYTRIGLNPRSVEEASKDDKADGWGRSSVQFAIDYVLDITRELNNI